MDLESGIFIPCEPGGERDCLTALRSVLNDSKDAISVENDKTHGGLRVVFPDPAKAREILQMRSVSPRFPVYALSTSLVVHTDQNKFREDFGDLLRDAMKDVGPVVDVHRIPFIENMNDFFTNDWKVVLGVPEKDDLPQFLKAGLPDNMTLKLPGFETEFRVTFCCSCKGEHTSWNCSSKTPVIVKTETQSSRIDSVATAKEVSDGGISPSVAAGSDFRIRDRREEGGPPLKKAKFDTPLSILDSMAQEIGEEQVLRTFGDELVSPKRKVPKREIGGTPSAPVNLSASSSAGDDSEVTFVASYRKFPMSKNMGLMRNSTEESAQVPTSSLPDGFGDVKPELPSTDDNSDSNQETTSPVSTPTNTNMNRIPKFRKLPNPDFSVHIPAPIRDIIQEIPGVLDVTRLEAFFNNVKKKSSPCMVARQYTDNVPGLKAQLQSIKDKYYHTPVMHSVKEKQFMKWFEPMLDRFDRKPCVKPRKRMAPASQHQQL